MVASPPKQVVDLVEHFERDRKVFLSPDCKEEQLRAESLNPFFIALGWDMDNPLTQFLPGLGEVSLSLRATGYNALAIPLAAGVLYSLGMVLTPAMGAMLMSISTVIVAINARLLRLRRESYP